MSSSGGGPGASPAWPPFRPSKRSKMRNGTFIIPSTGERSRRQVTLRASNGRSPSRPSGQASASSAETTESTTVDRAKENALAAWRWLNSEDGHQVLKCTLAYLLGSLGTLWPTLSDFLGNRDGKHIVATLTVYFHPARTVGSMLEAVFIAIIAVAYAEMVCVLSMAAAIASRTSMGSVVPAHAIVLVVFVGGSLGFIGWVKQKLNQPLVNVASTLASIAIISVVTKEQSIQDGYFSGDKILQVLKMLLIGISFTVAVNFLVWRVSARHVLRKSIVTASVCLSDRLSSISKGFLDGSEDEIKSPAYSHATAQYNSAYAQMSKSLREAKLEYYLLGRETTYQLDKRLFKSVEALSRAIGGLRSALDTQFTLLKEVPAAGPHPASAVSSPAPPPFSPRLVRAMSAFIDEAREPLSVIQEAEDEARASLPLTHSDPTLDKSPMFRAPSDIFALFMARLGPPMKSLVYTLSEILRESPFDQVSWVEVTINDQLQESLRDALSLYNQARGAALQELYRSIELGRCRSEKIQADIEEVAAACGHFSFTLLAVADEMDAYLEVLEDLKQTTAANERNWSWLKFWTYRKPFRWRRDMSPDPEREPLLQKTTVKPVKKSALPKGIPAAMVRQRDAFSWDAAPQSSLFLRTVSQSLLTMLRFLAREDITFGIKVGIGAVLWAMFAFIPDTRPMYQQWRGEWGLLSYMIVVGMTTGASNTTSTARFVGTLIGAICACVSWIASDDNPYLLALFGWLMACWNFYLILVIKNAPLGRISLLAYNVIVLYAYSLSQNVEDDDDDEGGTKPLIFNITYHRVVAVTLGILWGMIVCRLLWPISGRRKFREGLSVLYLQLGLIWKRGPLGILVESHNTLDYLREGEQVALQRYAFKLESLREAAKSEFELRGPFPHEAYGRIMHSTKHILDGFYAMRLITQRRLSLSAGERALLEFTTAERVRLCQRICHVFQVLASSIMLEYPLTDATPTIDSTKDQLLGKIYQFRKNHMGAELRQGEADDSDDDADADGGRGVAADERDYALLYAYTLVTAQVADELRKVRDEIEGLFGVLNQDELLLEYT
ncbi:fusaric acid resistance protein-like domain-containing protein [Hirsutella rhossiliensis]|uniref:Fusaric acid resistance protein-like domain-containing protein n=1 Tax=Hirsutella rhossiliensis TaxID=111463 RepID=A0A9P8NAI1_9HYPO|nr:fusaric acid resistance protein-like domain-containing protein [Hirsutella rhossiliensis]KAH0967587.1 fusaric acid resistance protein-like domain-containing protein [Hirsutella rhossiliensis]